MLKTLFLNPPSFEGFDGGAGSRYQARREIRSFWYPTWLAQPAALVPDSKLVDAPPADITVDDVAPMARDYELAVLHTSTPSFAADVKVAEILKDNNPKLKLGFVGSHVAVQPEISLKRSPAIDFVARNEFDFTIKEVAEGRPMAEIDGISYRQNGNIVHNRERAILENMDELPFVTEVYKRDLKMEDYIIGEALYPYISFYTGRGCRSKCTFCLWPQTVGGHRYRTRSPQHVIDEVKLGLKYFPGVKEFFLEDDTLTDAIPHVEAIARGLGELGVTWSCNAKVNVPFETLKVLKENGLRNFTVGYETGSQQILNNVKKGMKVSRARQFTEDCHKLGITIHGTFIVGLPGETKETIAETIAFAKEMNPHTLQVSLPAVYPGTFLYNQAMDNGWLRDHDEELVAQNGLQVTSIEYPHLSHQDIFEAVETFYRRFYLRPRKIAEIMLDMVRDRRVMARRLREGMEFFRFLGARADRA
jgi:hopanoid biosynthesis associated radical SAM protein HpnJ